MMGGVDGWMQWHQLDHMQTICTWIQQQQQRPLIRDNPGRPVPEETFKHSHASGSSCFLYHLSPFATVHGILFIQLTCLTVLTYRKSAENAFEII